MNESVRLNKHLAHTLGISRREADTRIEQGRVLLNGKIASLGNTVHLGKDSISIDNMVVLSASKKYTYVLFNKPVGYICSRKQQGDTPTIYSILPKQYQNLKVAGRLDKDSCGLLLLTDDGDRIFNLTHPKFAKEKTYLVGLNKPLTIDDKEQIVSGVMLEDGKSTFSVSRAKHSSKPNRYIVIMHEGRNRQIRRTFGGLRYMVTHLERISFGPHSLDDLKGKQFLQI